MKLSQFVLALAMLITSTVTALPVPNQTPAFDKPNILLTKKWMLGHSAPAGIEDDPAPATSVPRGTCATCLRDVADADRQMDYPSVRERSAVEKDEDEVEEVNEGARWGVKSRGTNWDGVAGAKNQPVETTDGARWTVRSDSKKAVEETTDGARWTVRGTAWDN